ncbi:MAG: SMP-30/gluconolactonase/LRE family protein, partial [Caldilineae bacterium]
MRDFRLDLSQLTFYGHDLSRPESVLAEKDGTLWASDNRGGVTRIAPDGAQQTIGSIEGEPNGLAMDPDGNILIADIHGGAIYRLHRDGRHEVILDEIDGQKPLGAANFVFIDSQDRLWISVSTREIPWFVAAAHPRPDGYIVLMDASGPRIVADGIYFPNEVRMDADENYLYVAETMKRRMLR